MIKTRSAIGNVAEAIEKIDKLSNYLHVVLASLKSGVFGPCGSEDEKKILEKIDKINKHLDLCKEVRTDGQ